MKGCSFSITLLRMLDTIWKKVLHIVQKNFYEKRKREINKERKKEKKKQKEEMC